MRFIVLIVVLCISFTSVSPLALQATVAIKLESS